MVLGIDVSTYLEQQRLTGVIYKKDGKPVDPFQLFIDRGVEYLRTRIWNNPFSLDGKPYLGGTCDLDSYLKLYDQLEKYHFKQVVDFHYSDFWVDPSKQFVPKAWKDKTFEEVEELVYSFTKESLLKMKNHGIDVALIQTGNEITHGMLWPHGKINYGSDNPYEHFARLLIAARKACKEIYPKAKIIIHLEESFNQALYREIISNLLCNGLEIDIIGTSYYPFWHHSFAEYFANMDMVQKEFHIPVMNVELGYPFTLEDYKVDEETGKPKHLVINADNQEEFKKMLPFEVSPRGQYQFIEKFLELAKEHGLLGAFYWEPLWIPGEGICWASEEGQLYQSDVVVKDARNEWANQCLFDYVGNALPGLDAFKNR